MSPDDPTATVERRSSEAGDPIPAPRFAHLRNLTDRKGIWEHAELFTPRIEHGFCLDDNARALVVVTQQASVSPGLADLAATYIGFVIESRTGGGGFHNRRDADGSWSDEIGSDDSQGRAWWGLGSAARAGATEQIQRAGAAAFDGCTAFDSPHLRSNAYAVLGSVDMLTASPGHAAAADLLQRASGVIADAAIARIPWPEQRLTYDNARLPQALMAAGAMIGDRRLTSAGLRTLEWLVGIETSDDHFSFTSATGRSTDGAGSRFDQQPIETWAMADACHQAWISTGEPVWKDLVVRAARWLLGNNDIGVAVYDEETGATGDGLMEHSINQNCGAESTIAGIGVLQAALAVAQDLPEIAQW